MFIRLEVDGSTFVVNNWGSFIQTIKQNRVGIIDNGSTDLTVGKIVGPINIKEDYLVLKDDTIIIHTPNIVPGSVKFDNVENLSFVSIGPINPNLVKSYTLTNLKNIYQIADPKSIAPFLFSKFRQIEVKNEIFLLMQ